MAIKFKKGSAYLCLLFSFIICVFYIYMNTRTDLFMEIPTKVLFGFVIIVLLVSGIYLLNIHIPNKKKRQRNLKIMWWLLFVYFVFQLGYFLFFDATFARDYSQGSGLDYKSQLILQWNTAKNLTPFETINSMIAVYGMPGIGKTFVNINLFGNFIAFMPFSFFLPFLFKPMKKWFVFIFFIAFLIVGVELTQLFTFTGSLDVDDFILNFSGALIFYIILKLPFIKRFCEKLKG